MISKFKAIIFKNIFLPYYFVIGIGITINSLYWISSQGSFLPLLHTSLPAAFFYLTYFIFTLAGASLLHFQKKNFSLDNFLKILIPIYLPSFLIFIYVLQKNFETTRYLGIFTAFYVALSNLLLIRQQIYQNNTPLPPAIKSPFLKRHPFFPIILLTMLISFSFGFFHLGKLAVVDEPLWTFDRIPNFWRDFSEMDWRNANVSDKPGQTVVAISGIGLLAENNPKQFKKIIGNATSPNLNASKMENFNIAFRLPILIFVILMLPVFHSFIKKLAGEISAILSVIFIALSPIILGNSRIINPDSILWIFTSLSILAFFLYLKNKDKNPLMWSAFFLGLGLLTKYTSNLLYFFFLGLIFVEYLFNYSRYEKIGFYAYFKKHFSDYLLLTFISMSTFFIFYPAAWGKPMRLLNSTILSQPVEPIWPVFVSIILFFLFDLLVLKNFVTEKIIHFFVPWKKIIPSIVANSFLFFTLLVFFNAYTEMAFFDFQEILASPKSSFSNTSLLSFFTANFYPLIFGVSPLALLPLLIFLLLSLRKNNFSSENQRHISYLLIFILIYYAGSTISHIASTIRYQIIVFPILLIASSISIHELLCILLIPKNYQKTNLPLKKYTFFLIIISLSIFSLWQIKPFYMGYASTLLPSQYHLDVKDMGEGSYEAAAYLNSLPNAKKLVIWTDKQGVCVFFVGKCHTKISVEFFANTKLDYLVVSSGRKSRTTKLRSELSITGVSIQDIYKTTKFEKLIPIANRENNNIKIINTTTIEN